MTICSCNIHDVIINQLVDLINLVYYHKLDGLYCDISLAYGLTYCHFMIHLTCDSRLRKSTNYILSFHAKTINFTLRNFEFNFQYLFDNAIYSFSQCDMYFYDTW